MAPVCTPASASSICMHATKPEAGDALGKGTQQGVLNLKQGRLTLSHMEEITKRNKIAGRAALWG